MNDAKYIGLDVHQATISVAVLDSSGKLVMEAILETKAETILQFIHGLRGSLHVTLEEGMLPLSGQRNAFRYADRPCRRVGVVKPTRRAPCQVLINRLIGNWKLAQSHIPRSFLVRVIIGANRRDKKAVTW
jgi:hypothetical protein